MEYKIMSAQEVLSASSRDQLNAERYRHIRAGHSHLVVEVSYDTGIGQMREVLRDENLDREVDLAISAQKKGSV